MLALGRIVPVSINGNYPLGRVTHHPHAACGVPPNVRRQGTPDFQRVGVPQRRPAGGLVGQHVGEQISQPWTKHPAVSRSSGKTQVGVGINCLHHRGGLHGLPRGQAIPASLGGKHRVTVGKFQQGEVAAAKEQVIAELLLPLQGGQPNAGGGCPHRRRAKLFQQMQRGGQIIVCQRQPQAHGAVEGFHRLGQLHAGGDMGRHIPCQAGRGKAAGKRHGVNPRAEGGTRRVRLRSRLRGKRQNAPRGGVQHHRFQRGIGRQGPPQQQRRQKAGSRAIGGSFRGRLPHRLAQTGHGVLQIGLQGGVNRQPAGGQRPAGGNLAAC